MRMDSQCKYGLIARGDAEIYLRFQVNSDYQENIWDHAGGYLLVTESGGAVHDSQGKPLDFTRGRKLLGNKGVIATNGRFPIMDQVNAMLKSK
jgi:3'(2'), 5'-bisphosphate nucleotidase